MSSIREEGSQKSARDACWYRVKLSFFKPDLKGRGIRGTIGSPDFIYDIGGFQAKTRLDYRGIVSDVSTKYLFFS